MRPLYKKMQLWNELAHGGGDAQRGEFAGRGPRGYTRSDEAIREELSEHLARDPDIDPSEVEVMVVEGEVLLTGTAESREDRRRIEDMAWEVSGVQQVQNRLRVGMAVHAPHPEVSAEEFDMPWPGRQRRSSGT